ncbi:MAG TPA: MaoC/PaaZ C-terminal domain-containing protein [Rhodocyclaceae bacterium]
MANESRAGFLSLLDMRPGTELGASDWYAVTQEDIDAFARLTRDEDPYHTDPGWAREHSPLETTISFGFLTMSMLTHFLHQVFGRLGIESGDDIQVFNFGFNRVRMPEPVPAGAEIRGRFSFVGARLRDNGGAEITVNAVVDIKGNDRPALVAEWLFVAVRGDGQGIDSC